MNVIYAVQVIRTIRGDIFISRDVQLKAGETVMCEAAADPKNPKGVRLSQCLFDYFTRCGCDSRGPFEVQLP